MTCGTFTVNKVTDAKRQQTMDLFNANDPAPTSVTSTADGTGTYTIVAVFPPCPTNTKHVSGGAT